MPGTAGSLACLESFRLLQPTTKPGHVLVPVLLERRLIPKVWGGRALAGLFGIELPAGTAIGESWELYDRPDGSSRVRGSAQTLAALVRRDPEAVVGRGVRLGHGGSFPLMLKFLDAREGLSLQVHPDDDQARAEHDSGKDECCVVLHAAPDARIVCGLRRGVDRAEFLARAHTAAVEQMVCAFRPEVGDVIHIPPGTVHGIGPGVVVFEVQQNSDLTYRLYDWGRGREVHVERALGVAQMAPFAGDRPVVAPETLQDGGTLLIATDHFRVRRYLPRRPLELATHGRFVTLTAVAGAARVAWAGAPMGPLAIAVGDTMLVPACVPAVRIEPDDHLDLLVCDPGGG